jgi:hypothetical protein
VAHRGTNSVNLTLTRIITTNSSPGSEPASLTNPLYRWLYSRTNQLEALSLLLESAFGPWLLIARIDGKSVEHTGKYRAHCPETAKAKRTTLIKLKLLSETSPPLLCASYGGPSPLITIAGLRAASIEVKPSR